MRALAIVHQRDAGPGVFADAIRARGVELESWLVAEQASPSRDPGDYDAVLSLGGAMHTDHENRHPWLRREKALLAELLERGVPLLGVCLGAQLLAEAAGAPARRASEPEIGWYDVEVAPEASDDPLMAPLAPRFEAFEWHSYECDLPESAIVLARSPVCVQAYRYGPAAWGIQFHAEVSQRIVSSWFDDYQTDPDAIAIGLDPERAKAESEERIGRWNGIGRGICARFLEVAAAAPSRP